MTTSVPTPLVVVWRVTERCDLDCVFCEYRRSARRPRRTADPAQILAFGSVLADYSCMAQRPVLVSWLGGEPLLWRPLAHIARIFNHDLGLQLGVTTNGARLGDRSLLQHLAETYHQVTVSLDGPDAHHDSVRGRPGLFDNLRAGISSLADLKARLGCSPLIRVNTILMQSTLTGLEDLCRELAGWGVNEVTFNALGGQPSDAFYNRQRLPPHHTAWLHRELPGIQRRLAAAGLVLRGSAGYTRRLHSAATLTAQPGHACQPARDFFFIDELGRAGPCSFTLDTLGVPISTITSASDLAALPTRLAHARRLSQPAPCLNCPSTQVFGKFSAATDTVVSNASTPLHLPLSAAALAPFTASERAAIVLPLGAGGWG